MPFTCAVADCENSKTTKSIRGSLLTYHRFPKDKKLLKIWASKCRRGEAGITFHDKRICSDHFITDDFESNLREELLGYLRHEG